MLHHVVQCIHESLPRVPRTVDYNIVDPRSSKYDLHMHIVLYGPIELEQENLKSNIEVTNSSFNIEVTEIIVTHVIEVTLKDSSNIGNRSNIEVTNSSFNIIVVTHVVEVTLKDSRRNIVDVSNVIIATEHITWKGLLPSTWKCSKNIDNIIDSITWKDDLLIDAYSSNENIFEIIVVVIVI
ncbi:hypothetical protein ACJX0J_012970 [Zea mays]